MEMFVQVERKRIPILMYHSISEEASPKFRLFAVPPARFAEQMAYLYRQAYTPLTVSQLVQACRDGAAALPAKPVVLTFDDAFLDFYTAALPVLQRYGLPATLYIPTRYVNRTSRWMQRIGEGSRPLLSWQQLQEVSRSGIECGAHSHSHPQLDLLPVARAKQEIFQSKRILEEHLGQAIASFAYPHGYHTTAVRQLVRLAGYSSACAVGYALSTETTDPFALTRLLVSPDMDVHSFAALLDGHDRRVTFASYTRPLAPVWRGVRYYSALVQRSQRGKEILQ